MTKRRESREQAFTLLFEKTVTGDSMEDIIEMAKEARNIVIDPYCEKLTALTELYLDEIDHTIEETQPGWRLRRLYKMTLTILRVAVCEMQFMQADDVPVSVSINEAVELAKIYGNEKGRLLRKRRTFHDCKRSLRERRTRRRAKNAQHQRRSV